MLTVRRGGLSPLRGPSASHKAGNSIDNVAGRRKAQPTGRTQAGLNAGEASE
jgi:hypothetical protein